MQLQVWRAQARLSPVVRRQLPSDAGAVAAGAGIRGGVLPSGSGSRGAAQWPRRRTTQRGMATSALDTGARPASRGDGQPGVERQLRAIALRQGGVSLASARRAEQLLGPEGEKAHPWLRMYHFNLVVQAFERARAMEDAERVADRARRQGLEWDVVTFNLLIRGCGAQRDMDGVVRWFQRLRDSEAVQPTRYTCLTLMNAYAECGDVASAREVLAYFEGRRLVEVGERELSALLKAAGEYGAWSEVESVWALMESRLPRLGHGSHMLRALYAAKLGEEDAVEECVKYVLDRGVGDMFARRAALLLRLLDAVAARQGPRRAADLAVRIADTGEAPVEVMNKALHLVAECGDEDGVRHMLALYARSTTPLGTVAFNVLMRHVRRRAARGRGGVAPSTSGSGVGGGAVADAMTVLRMMRDAGEEPDAVTLGELLRALAEAGEEDTALHIFGRAKLELGIAPDQYAATVLLQHLAGQRWSREREAAAEEVVCTLLRGQEEGEGGSGGEASLRPPVCNALLEGAVRGGHSGAARSSVARAALGAWKRLRGFVGAPDRYLFNNVLHAAGMVGDGEAARLAVTDMGRFGVTASMLTVGRLAVALQKAGDVRTTTTTSTGSKTGGGSGGSWRKRRVEAAVRSAEEALAACGVPLPADVTEAEARAFALTFVAKHGGDPRARRQAPRRKGRNAGAGAADAAAKARSGSPRASLSSVV